MIYDDCPTFLPAVASWIDAARQEVKGFVAAVAVRWQKAARRLAAPKPPRRLALDHLILYNEPKGEQRGRHARALPAGGDERDHFSDAAKPASTRAR